MAIKILHINHSGGTMENINENGSEIEEISEVNDSTENMAEQQDTNVEYSKTETKKETKQASGLLKAGIALTLACSALSLGASGYALFSKDDNRDNSSNESASNVSTGDVSIAISQDGYWVINGMKTNVKAAGSNGENGTDGKTPHIGENGNWFIGETDTGIKAEGQNGENGTDGEDGEDGTDGISVVNAEEISNDKWGIEKYIMFELSNGSYIATSPQKTINNGHYYEAESEEDIKELVEYGVKKIQIAKDFTILRSMTFSSDVEFDLNRKTLTYAASSPIVVENNCLMSFKNGSVVLRTQKAILVNGANSIVKFDDVSISANATVVESLGSNTNIVLKETTLSSETTGAVTFAARAASSESLFVFKGENAKIEVVDTKIVTKKTIIAAENTAQNISINIETSKIESTTAIMNIDTTAVKTDFVVDDNTMENTTAESLTVEPLTGGTFNFNPAEMNMTAAGYDAYNVNGKWVVAESFAGLVSLIDNGSTIVLNKDLDLPTAVVVDKEITLDLNYCNLSITEDTEGYGVFYVTTGGHLTIEGEGIINGVGKNGWNIVLWAYGGTIVINGGTYTNIGAGSDDHYDVIYASAGGSIVINDGTFYGQTPAWILNLKDADRATSNITVYGGTFHGFDPANNAAEGKGTNFVADGYVVVGRNDVYTLEESFEDAVKDATVSSISLTKDVALSETLNIDRDLTINLGGHKITSSVIALNIVDGNVTIDNGTISASGNNHALYVNGTATGSDISLTLGDKLTVNSESCAIFIKGAGAKLVTSATLYSNGPYATISGNGNTGNEVNSISIVGGKVTHESYIAIYVPQTGSFNISGGEITGTTALYVKSGNLNISGGKLKATHEFTDYVYSGNGAKFYGDALIIDACGYPGGNPVVNITGGTFETTDSKAHGIAYYSYNGNSATINAAGYEVATHEIVLTEAQLHAAIANETIENVTLGANITVTQYIQVRRKLTLDLGGKILSRNSSNLQTICVFAGGDLTIEGEGTIKGFGAGSGSIAVWAYGGNVTINGGHYTNVGAGEGDHHDLIYASNGGHIVINNGTFEGQTPAWLLNMLDADREISSITVNGGSFVGFNPGNNAVEGPETNFVAVNAVVSEKDGVFTVTVRK